MNRPARERFAPSRKADEYATGEVARLVGVHRNSVIYWIETGRLECRRDGRGYRHIRAIDLVRFLTSWHMTIPPALVTCALTGTSR